MGDNMNTDPLMGDVWPSQTEVPDPITDRPEMAGDTQQDRQMPGVDVVIRPNDFGWYDYTPSQRWSAILASHVIVMDAVERSDFSDVDDDTLMILGWGANDEEAIAYGEDALGQHADKFIGEGENEWGWLRINGTDSSFTDHFQISMMGPTGQGYVNQVARRINDTMEADRGFFGKAFYEPGELTLFMQAANGGNMTKTEQVAHHNANLGAEVAATAMLAQFTMGFGLGTKMGQLTTKATSLMGATPQALSMFKKGAAGYQATRGLRVGTAVGASGLYFASLALGAIGDPYAEMVMPMIDAVEKGEMDPESASAMIAATAEIANIEIPKEVEDLDWYIAPAESPPSVDRGDPMERMEGYPETDNPLAIIDRAKQMWNEATGGASPLAVATAFNQYTLDGDTEDVARRVADEIQAINGPGEAALARVEAVRAAEARRGSTMGGFDPAMRVRPTVTEAPGEMHPAFADIELGNPDADQLAYLTETYVPRYYEQDVENIMGSWSQDRVEWFQNQAILAGLIDPEDFTLFGTRDYKTRNAFASITTDANANGNTWEDQLSENVSSYQSWLADNPEEEPHYPAFVTPAYKKPDYATLAQQVKGRMTSILGRRANQAELKLLTDHLGALDRQQWDGMVSAERAEHSARAREWETREDGAPAEQSAGTVQQVDSLSRFDEYFEKHFKGEIEHRERVEGVQENQQNLFASLNRIAGSM